MYRLTMILLLCAGWSAGLSAQNQAHYVKINPPLQLPEFGMRIAAVEDLRPNQESIGIAQRGMNNRAVPAKFKRPVPAALQAYFDKLIQPAADAIPVTVRVHELTVSEFTTFSKETARCEVRLEFLRLQDDQLVSLGAYESVIENGGLDVSSGHGRRVGKALYSCLAQVANTDWRDLGDAEPVQAAIKRSAPESTDWTATTQPVKGIYTTTTDIINHTPDTDRTFEVQPMGTANVHFQLRDDRNKRIKRIAGFSDGKYLYLSASTYNTGNYYLRAIAQGRYIYFEDRFSDPMAGVAFGAIGAIASNKLRSIVLDTQNGQTIILNKERMRKLLAPYPALLRRYQESDKRVPDNREIIGLVNEQALLN